jgi:hypothetical protein
MIYPTQAEVKKAFEYYDGHLYRGGSIAGCTNTQGYRVIKYKSKQYKEHQLVWIYFYGSPAKLTDHINHDRADNHIENLREVSFQENARNATLNIKNTSGIAGVHWHKSNKRWSVWVYVNRKYKHIGTYRDLHEAVSARLFANSYYGFHENHGVSV